MGDEPPRPVASVLRAWQRSDWDKFVSIALNPNVAKFMGEGFPRSRESAVQKFESILSSMEGSQGAAPLLLDCSSIDRMKQQQHLYLAITDESGCVIGGYALHRLSPDPDAALFHCASTGYWLGEEHWGHGWATKATTAGCAIAAKIGFHRVEATTFGENEASQRVLVKCGFAREGTRRGGFVTGDGAVHDEALFGKLL